MHRWIMIGAILLGTVLVAIDHLSVAPPPQEEAAG